MIMMPLSTSTTLTIQQHTVSGDPKEADIET